MPTTPGQLRAQRSTGNLLYTPYRPKNSKPKSLKGHHNPPPDDQLIRVRKSSGQFEATAIQVMVFLLEKRPDRSMEYDLLRRIMQLWYRAQGTSIWDTIFEDLAGSDCFYIQTHEKEPPRITLQPEHDTVTVQPNRSTPSGSYYRDEAEENRLTRHPNINIREPLFLDGLDNDGGPRAHSIASSSRRVPTYDPNPDSRAAGDPNDRNLIRKAKSCLTLNQDSVSARKGHTYQVLRQSRGLAYKK